MACACANRHRFPGARRAAAHLRRGSRLGAATSNWQSDLENWLQSNSLWADITTPLSLAYGLPPTQASMQQANQDALQSGAMTVPYPGQGIPSNAPPEIAITYGSADPNTGVVNQDLANYMINGGPPPASVLTIDPSAQPIAPLQSIMNAAAATPPGLPVWAWILIALGGAFALYELAT